MTIKEKWKTKNLVTDWVTDYNSKKIWIGRNMKKKNRLRNDKMMLISTKKCWGREKWKGKCEGGWTFKIFPKRWGFRIFS